MAYQKRLKKEYEELSLRAPTGIVLDQETMEDNIDMLVALLPSGDQNDPNHGPSSLRLGYAGCTH